MKPCKLGEIRYIFGHRQVAEQKMRARDKILIVFDTGKGVKQRCSDKPADPSQLDEKIHKPEYGGDEQGTEHHNAESGKSEI